mgnify:CR=1 FL=1|tara:strand:- start:3009 stop:3290 length:282 start_codon:yes stop_codon:yes gene_type:complete
MSELKGPIYLNVDRANRPAFDKNNQEIKEFDLIKIFHFTGQRRKKHYTYKHIRKSKEGKLICKHLNECDDGFLYMCLHSLNKNDIEIIQRGGE